MKFFQKKTIMIIILAEIIIFIFGMNRYQQVQKAHQTFENYYAFQGCAKLLQKDTDFGICKTNAGQTIKIVLYQGKWYLDGDIPCNNFLCL